MKTVKDEVMSSCSTIQKGCLEIAQEKGASSWLITLPIKKYGFALHKSEFHDALCLRYNWSLDKLPTQCACSSSFSLDHALNCLKGGSPTKWHNEVRDITAGFMSQTCHSVVVEPQLQPLSAESFTFASTNVDDEARSDICAPGFGGMDSKELFST